VSGPPAIRTAEHVQEARKHDEIARSRTATPVTSEPGSPVKPWVAKWDPEAPSDSKAIEAEYAAACGRREVEKTVGSPLTRHRVGGWNTERGVVVLLSPLAGPEPQLIGDLRCYRAWLLAGTGVEKDSPLAVPGLIVDAKGNQDGIELTLTLRDSRLIPELQRRVSRQVEELRQPPRHED
jgi:hypothetical protein